MELELFQFMEEEWEILECNALLLPCGEKDFILQDQWSNIHSVKLLDNSFTLWLAPSLCYSHLFVLHCVCVCVCVHKLDCIPSGGVPINPIFLMKCRRLPTRGCCVAAEDRCPAGFGRAFMRFALINTQQAVSNGPYRIASVSWATIWTLCFHYGVTVYSAETCRVSDCRK